MAGNVIFRLAGTGQGTAQRITEDGSAHVIHADAVPAFGGEDSAPSPLTLALAALTSCSQVTSTLVARDLGVRTGAYDWTLEAAFDPAVIATGAEGNPNFSRVAVTLSVETDAAPEQFAKLQRETERRCPVFQMYQRSGVAISGDWRARALPAAKAA